MDESTVRSEAEAHARATVERDYATAGSVLSPEAMAQTKDVMAQMPKPLTGSEVLKVEPEGDGYIAIIRYTGENDDVTVESRWSELEGSPRITNLRVV